MCTYNGKNYSEGSLVCANGRELKCSGSEWRETGYLCTPKSLTDLSIYEKTVISSSKSADESNTKE